MSDLGDVVLVLLIGIGTGVLSGMFGLGGGVVSNPALRAVGAGPLTAVGSTLPSIIPSAISGSIRYSREGLVRGDVFRWTVVPGIAASVCGALATDAVPGDGHPLTIAISVILAVTAIRLARSRPSIEVRTDDPASPAGPGSRVQTLRTSRMRSAGIGVAAGGVSGLLGLGGGVILVPAFTGWLGLPLKSALATSLACVGVLGIPGTVTHAFLGHIQWSYAVPLGIGVIPGAQLGAHLAIRAAERTLRTVVGSVLGSIAMVYFVGEIVALSR